MRRLEGEKMREGQEEKRWMKEVGRWKMDGDQRSEVGSRMSEAKRSTREDEGRGKMDERDRS